MMEKAGAGAFDHSLELGNLMRPTSDIQYRDARQFERFCRSTHFWLDEPGKMSFDKLQLLQNRIAFLSARLQRPLPFRHHRRELDHALVTALTARSLTRKPLVEIANDVVGRFPVTLPCGSV